MPTLTHSTSIVITREPDELYDMVADVTRMGEWSPTCKACRWDAGDGARVGAWFTGRNQDAERTWTTRSQVIVADRGREFAFVVGGTYVRWGYTFTRARGGTLLSENWALLPDGVALFRQRHGADAESEIQRRADVAANDMTATLTAIRHAAEAASPTRASQPSIARRLDA